MFITFLTDFGLEDDFVGTCHGVLKRIAPDAQIIDITHGIRPGHVLQAALMLANTLPYMPVGVHLAVVDPGVGGGRRPLALRDAEGRLYVGPDNGLLLPAAERFGGVVDAHELANPEYALDSVSRTFHGRDLFSPAAAHLALGVSIGELGPPVDPDALVRLDVPQPDVGQQRIRALVLGVDRFGNIALNLSREHLDAIGVVPGMRVELAARGNRYYAVAARTFGDATPGGLILYEDSYRAVAIAVTQGSAAALLGVEEGGRDRPPSRFLLNRTGTACYVPPHREFATRSHRSGRLGAPKRAQARMGAPLEIDRAPSHSSPRPTWRARHAAGKWRGPDSNRRHPGFQPSALPAELPRRWRRSV